MAILHATAEFIDQLAHGDAGGRELDARILHTARHGEAAEALAFMAALRSHPFGALLDDVAYPVHRLDVLLERWTSKKTNLRNVRRAMTGQPTLAFDRFDHRRLFTADIGAGAASQMQFGMLRKSCLLHILDLVQQHQ